MRARAATGQREGGRGPSLQTQRQEEASLKQDRGQAPGEAGTQSSGSESDMPGPPSGQPSLHLRLWPPYPSLSLWDLAGGPVFGQLDSAEDGEPGSAAL